MNLFDFLKREALRIKIENGDITYRRTSEHCVDLFGVIGFSRANLAELVDLFNRAYKENPKLALKILMYARDIRGGLGEREVFRTIFKSLCKNDTKVARQLLPYISDVGRYDDIFAALFTPVEQDVVAIVYTILREDIDSLARGGNVSLLSKWMPSINTSNRESVLMAKRLAKRLHMNDAQYRKMLSSLRKGRIVENNLRERDYTFDYQSIPTLALRKYRQSFYKNDTDRYTDYINSLSDEEKKVNTTTIYLCDIIKDAQNIFSINEMSEENKLIMQERWDNIERNQNLENTIVVRDGSSSMACNNCLPLLIANSLSIYFSELLSGKFKNKFITFSKEPKLVELESTDLYGKLVELSNCNDASNIDISKVYELLLNIYKEGINKDDIIKRILIITDVDFEVGVEGVSNFKTFKKRFEMLGIEIPEIIYWNVNAKNIRFATSLEYENISYISGTSNKILESLIKNGKIDNENFVNDVVSKYDYIDDFEMEWILMGY